MRFTKSWRYLKLLLGFAREACVDVVFHGSAFWKDTTPTGVIITSSAA